MAVNRFACTILNAVKNCRLYFLTAVHEHRISARQTQHRGLARAKRPCQFRLNLVINTEPLAILLDARHANVIGHTHGHGVFRFLQSKTQRFQAVEFTLIIISGLVEQLAFFIFYDIPLGIDFNLIQICAAKFRRGVRLARGGIFCVLLLQQRAAFIGVLALNDKWRVKHLSGRRIALI